MTNDELGQRIGVSHSMASRIRNGQRLPGVDTMTAMHKELGIPLEELHDAHSRGAKSMGVLVRRHLGRKPVAA